MPWTVTEFEDTPNPNAMKCWLDAPISDGPQSFRDAASAAAHPVVAALFDRAGVTCVLLLGNWLTVNKPPSARWPKVKTAVKAVLADASLGDAATESSPDAAPPTGAGP
ncbi:MAG: NifU N-terminal domain-containing protein [Phycisphaerales bacterium]